ncbi:MAG: N-formylglutamate amidohydrolase [Actinobacteria bacterium]|uniref:Unannotated protein n=1 Tax=freshwater metagenome TaxID=449393 RepID=A0A6J7CIF8_9ZZZZ|nr:N-formylglutamate amidohydrolase [Actinomycetota bacterium]MSX24416.1 N-formylglutamate amidohydrolase [Actinomycetota bacterium]MSY46029.1 N-formylglutamate amidohydrolase [Actinomycetota bacterium]MSY57054.1 N-formylglutamate amidohydrolase [Actinomycetota bacterium]MTB00100.1 N-formylglutamate amidohydrolase [Actinomycetota bacterium]
MTDINFHIIPGDPRSSVILHVPHSSRLIPSHLRSQLLLDDQALDIELNEMTDTHTEEIARESASGSAMKPWLFINNYSRLVIDPERFPDARESMNAVGMGAVYLKTSGGQILRNSNSQRDQALIAEFFTPYAGAIQALVGERLDSLGKVTIIDTHSYRPTPHPSSLNQEQRRPEICIGTDAFHTAESLLAKAREAFSGFSSVVENEPYAGTYVPLAFYEIDKRVQAIMMEIRADTFLNEDLLPHQGLTKIVKSLTDLIDSVS